MDALKKSIYFLFSFFLLTPSLGFSQNQESRDSLNIELTNAAREIMTAAGTCALITLDKEGRPRARAMAPFLPENDFTVWFGTNSKSRKVNQIKNDSRVTLYYLDDDASGYVMIQGEAELVNDKKEKEKRWKDEWEAFYPNRPEGYLLIKVTPKWMEVSSNKRGIKSDSVTWQPATLHFNSKQ